jgi:transglutaminase-like putative cysteine protease
MLLTIEHETRYRQGVPGPVTQRLKLTPRQDTGQTVAHWRIEAPGPTQVKRDAHGNLTHFLALPESLDEIVVRVQGQVETSDEPVVMPEGGLPLAIYLATTPKTRVSPELAGFARDCLNCEPDPVYGLFDLMAGVRRQVPALPCLPYAGGSAAEAFRLGVGAKEDLVHVFISACRSLGIPARFISGYLHHGEATSVASHAWAEAWVRDLGWIGFDVRYNRTADGRLCRLAIGRDHAEACPILPLHPDASPLAMH